MPGRTPLLIYVIWHPAFTNGQEYFDLIYSSLVRSQADPLQRGTGIQVIKLTSDVNEIPYLHKYRDPDTHYIFIVFIEGNIVVDEQWGGLLQEIGTRYATQPSKHLIVPVQVGGKSYSNPDGIPSRIQQIRLNDVDPAIKNDHLVTRVANTIYQFLQNGGEYTNDNDKLVKLRLFLSHAKKDGKDLTIDLNKFIRNNFGIEVFFDALNIDAGYAFDKQIKEAASNSALLIVQTDLYSSRSWCRQEALTAKLYQCPIIIFNHFESGEKRGFPYMSNVPVIKLKNDLSQDELFAGMLKHAMLEFLRFEYQKEYLLYLNQIYNEAGASTAIFPSPPELITILPFKDTETTILYPDPVLGNEETELFIKFNKNIRFLTPQLLPLLKQINSGNTKPLNGIKAGLSISDSNPEFSNGFAEADLQDVMVDLTRYLLATGATLVYGGSLHKMNGINFTQILFDLVRMYNDENTDPASKVFNYTVFPYSEAITIDVRAELLSVAKINIVPLPNDIVVDKTEWVSYINANDPQKKQVTAQALTLMRQKMNDVTQARVFIGGKVYGFDGKYPGVLEEVILALKSQLPIYLIGAYGGCTSLIIDLLKQAPDAEMAIEAGADPRSVRYNSFINNYPEECGWLKGLTLTHLNNGLSDEDNLELSHTINLTKITQLVLKGMLNKFTV